MAKYSPIEKFTDKKKWISVVEFYQKNKIKNVQPNIVPAAKLQSKPAPIF
jgi:hypothetical protein